MLRIYLKNIKKILKPLVLIYEKLCTKNMKKTLKENINVTGVRFRRQKSAFVSQVKVINCTVEFKAIPF